MPSEPPILLIASTSAGKIREFRQLLANLPARLAIPSDLGIDIDVEEGEASFDENAALKARAYGEASGVLTLAEDAGLEVDALERAPGVRSSRWGDTSDYVVKNRLILNLLEGRPREERRCRYVSHLAIRESDGRLYLRSGACEGHVAFESAGDGGFGYDPIFYIPRLRRTMAQLDTDGKDHISHRGRAVRKALPLLLRLVAAAK